MWNSPDGLLSYQADHHSAGYNPPMPQSISVQGCSLSFAEQGSGEPVVFIQGVGLHGEGWRPQDLNRDLNRDRRRVCRR